MTKSLPVSVFLETSSMRGRYIDDKLNNMASNILHVIRFFESVETVNSFRKTSK